MSSGEADGAYATKKWIMDKQHPPMADKVICVDFDGTLYPFGHMFDFPPPIDGAVTAVQNFKRAGYTIVIFTSRLSPSWLDSVDHFLDEHLTYIKTILQRDGIPFDKITSEKVPAAFYIDDKAVQFKGNWTEIAEIVPK